MKVFVVLIYFLTLIATISVSGILWAHNLADGANAMAWLAGIFMLLGGIFLGGGFENGWFN